MNKNNRRLAVFGLIGLIIVSIVAISLAVGSESNTVINRKILIPKSLSTGVSYAENTLLFSNDSSLATYNYTDGKTAVISPLDVPQGLANIDSLSVSDNNQYALFHLDRTTVGGRLYNRLLELKMDYTLDYWWKYDVANKMFTPLQSGVLLAKISGTSVYTLNSEGKHESIKEYGLSDLKLNKNIDVPLISDFFISQQGIVLQKTNQDILLTTDGILSSLLLKSSQVIGTSLDKQHIIVVTSINNSSRNLIIFSLKDKSQKTIEKNIINKPVFNKGIAIYSSGRAQDFTDIRIHTFDTSTFKATTWQLTDQAIAQKNNPLNAVELLNLSSAIVNDNDHYYLVGNNLAKLPSSLNSN